MKKIIIVLIIAGGWYVNKNGWPEFVRNANVPVITNSSSPAKPAPSSVPFPKNTQAAANNFSCDGRQHCSQMRSYDEAVFFLRNCPNTKMDGDGDGIPCERQFGR